MLDNDIAKVSLRSFGGRVADIITNQLYGKGGFGLSKVRRIKSASFPKADYGTTVRKCHGNFSENVDVEFNFWTILNVAL